MLDPEFIKAVHDKHKGGTFYISKITTVGDFFGNDCKRAYILLENFVKNPIDYPDIYARLLMACEVDQVLFLSLRFPKIALDEEIITTYIVLMRRGLFLDLIKADARAKELIMLVEAGIMMGLGK